MEKGPEAVTGVAAAYGITRPFAIKAVTDQWILGRTGPSISCLHPLTRRPCANLPGWG